MNDARANKTIIPSQNFVTFPRFSCGSEVRGENLRPETNAQMKNCSYLSRALRLAGTPETSSELKFSKSLSGSPIKVLGVVMLSSSRVGSVSHTFRFLWVALFLLAPGKSLANLFLELPTGGGVPLISASQSLFAPVAIQDPRLELTFGFGTDETFAPGQFFDSFTISLQDSGAAFTAVLLAVDASGLTLAPPTPGGLAVNPLSFTFDSTSIPPLSTTLEKQFSFRLNAPIPAQMLGAPINVQFDLFDNLDSVKSIGWVSEIAIVPEPVPAIGALMLLAVAVFRISLRAAHLRREAKPKAGLCREIN